MRRGRLMLLLMAMMLGLTGCWDFRGLEQRGFLVMLGIDRDEKGGFHVSAQLQIGRTERAMGDPNVSAARPFRVVTGDGPTIGAALEQVRSLIVRELDVTFLDSIVIGERAAADLGDLDWVLRSFAVPATSFISVTRGAAEPIVRATTPIFGLPGLFVLRGFSGAWTRSPAAIGVSLWTFFNRRYFTPLEDPYAPVLTSELHGVNWDGLALFRGHTLVGFLTKEETALYAMVVERRVRRALVAPLHGHPKMLITAMLEGGRVRRRVTWEKGQPVLRVEMRLRGDLAEAIGPHTPSPFTNTQFEAALASELSEEITRLVKRLQELDADPIGFGELAREVAPHRPEVQSGAAWHAAYRKAPVRVSAQITLTTSGYIE